MEKSDDFWKRFKKPRRSKRALDDVEKEYGSLGGFFVEASLYDIVDRYGQVVGVHHHRCGLLILDDHKSAIEPMVMIANDRDDNFIQKLGGVRIGNLRSMEIRLLTPAGFDYDLCYAHLLSRSDEVSCFPTASKGLLIMDALQRGTIVLDSADASFHICGVQNLADAKQLVSWLTRVSGFIADSEETHQDKKRKIEAVSS